MKPITVTTTGVSDSTPVIVDHHGKGEIYVQVVVSGSATYSVQQTLNNPWDTTTTVTWFDNPTAAVVGATTNQQVTYLVAPFAIRLHQTAGAGSATMTVLQSGEANG